MPPQVVTFSTVFQGRHQPRKDSICSSEGLGLDMKCTDSVVFGETTISFLNYENEYPEMN